MNISHNISHGNNSKITSAHFSSSHKVLASGTSHSNHSNHSKYLESDYFLPNRSRENYYSRKYGGDNTIEHFKKSYQGVLKLLSHASEILGIVFNTKIFSTTVKRQRS